MSQDYFPPLDSFAPRHIGPRGDDVAAMLKEVGAASLDALIDEAIPASIRLKAPLDLPPAESESTYLARLKGIAQKNKVFRSFIGEPRLVHALYPVPGGDRARPSRIAPQLPDDGVGLDGNGGGQRVAAG